MSVSLWKLVALPEPEVEYKFLDERRFRFDYAWPSYKVALELQGGVWSHGRHTRPLGYSNDCVKLNLGQLAGWIVIWATTEQMDSGEAYDWVREALARRGYGKKQVPN